VTSLREGLGPEHPMLQEVVEIDDAAHRAASLTRQLLAFGRRDVIQPVTLDLNGAVSDASRMLSRLVGEDVELVLRLRPEPTFVVADAARLQQVILNLVVNARDAMPRGGAVTLETRNCTVGTGHPALAPGDYALLSIRDTGCGMSADVQRHLFEPFFTTKGAGQGTGLGLATVFGIVKQAGGHIEVESAPGNGSSFDVYLPCSPPDPAAHHGAPAAATRVGRGETILLVEDEPAVLKRAAGILESAGYRVVAASDGDEAALLHSRCPGTFDLLLTDVIMPRTSGPDLAERLRANDRGLRVLFMSGYTDEYVSRDGGIRQGARIVEKPFDSRTLLAAVGEALDTAPAATPVRRSA
jgi:two-component system, cell cycle sensor histidine kinase and response regulator CckA